MTTEANADRAEDLDPLEDADGRFPRAVWGLVVAAYVLQASTVLRANWAWIVDRTPDDAFYYLQIARHLGEGNGATFDGINSTNGFHPLWQALITPLTWVFDDEVALTKATMLVGLGLGLGAVVLLTHLLRPAVGRAPAALVALVVVHGAALGWQGNGMESSIVVFVVVAVAWSITRFDRRRSPGSAVLVGVLCGALVLARIDFGPVLLIVPLALAGRVRSAWPVRPWLIGGGAVVVPVLGLGLAAFGHLLTVSGKIKLAWVADLSEDHWGGRVSLGYVGFVLRSGWLYLIALARDAGGTIMAVLGGPAGWLGQWLMVPVAVVGGATWWRSAARRSAVRRPLSGPAYALLTVGSAVALKGLMDVVMLPIWARAWYSAPPRVMTGVLVGLGLWQVVRLAARHGGATAGRVSAALAVVVLFPMAAWSSGAADHRAGSSWQATLDDAADWVLDEGPDGVYGAYDAGLLGYRLHGTHPVVNLDGLVNDYEHAALALDGATTEELVEHNGVDYLVQRMDDEAVASMDCARPLWRSTSLVTSAGLTLSDGLTHWPVHVLDVRACRGSDG